MVVMESSSSSGCAQPQTTDGDVHIPREEYPDWAKEGHYDGVMLYDSRDADEAFIFKQIIEKFTTLENGQKASLCVLDNSDNLVWVQGRFSALEEAIKRSTFLFLFMTENLCNDNNHYAKWLRDETLMEVLHNREKHWCLVPIHTRKRTEEGYVNPFGIRSLRGVNVSRMLKDKTLNVLDTDGVENLKKESLDRQILQNIQKTLNSKLNLRIARERHQDKEIEKWKSEERHRRNLECLKSAHEEELATYKKEQETKELQKVMLRDKENVKNYIKQKPATDINTVSKWKAEADQPEILPTHVRNVVDVLLEGKQSKETIFSAVSGMSQGDLSLIPKVAQYIVSHRSHLTQGQGTMEQPAGVEQSQPPTTQQIMIFQQVEKVQIDTSSHVRSHSSDSDEEVYSVVEVDGPCDPTGGSRSSEDQPHPLMSSHGHDAGDTSGSISGLDLRETGLRSKVHYRPTGRRGSPVEDECLPYSDELTSVNDDEVDNSGSDISPCSSHLDILQPANPNALDRNIMMGGKTHNYSQIQQKNVFPNEAGTLPAFKLRNEEFTHTLNQSKESSSDEETEAKHSWLSHLTESSNDPRSPQAGTLGAQADSQLDGIGTILDNFVIVKPPRIDLNQDLPKVSSEYGIEMRNLKAIGKVEDEEDDTKVLKVNKVSKSPH